MIILDKRKDVKGLIIKVLRDHPEGLMLSELAKITDMNRFTVTKYIHELKGNGSVFQKEAAAAKMCYLRSNLNKKIRNRVVIGQLKRM